MCFTLQQMFCGLRGAFFRSCGWKWVSALIAIFGTIVLSPDAFSQTPNITQAPAPQTIFLGDPATFQVSADGSLPLSYQWYRNGSPIAGATDPALTIPAVAGVDHQVQFSVRVTNALGLVISSPVSLTVD